jgi:hypothetical protein
MKAGALEAAVRQQRYELAALRLLLGVIEAIEAAAPGTRDELELLLTSDGSDGVDGSDGGHAKGRRP